MVHRRGARTAALCSFFTSSLTSAICGLLATARLRGRRASQGGHSGGCQVAMADGSVRFVSESISPATWLAAQTPDAGDVLGPDWNN